MPGDDPVGFLVWILMLPVIAGAVVGLLVGLGFAVVMGLAAFNHGLARLVRRTADAIHARRVASQERAADVMPDEP
ncbi:hypothetical protein ACFVSU_12460 [Microbacterium sp. NPDC058062]|uniref:hypothetical protein n=1 Tax=Microbacterium sp. NPDC058062 TaxID=3346320 RepID=UPI0036D88CEA